MGPEPEPVPVSLLQEPILPPYGSDPDDAPDLRHAWQTNAWAHQIARSFAVPATLIGAELDDDELPVIEEMLRKGYGIFVETDKGPVRVKKFNPARMTYIISEVVEDETAGALPGPEPMKALPAGDQPAPARKPRGRPRTRDREVPLAGSRATAIGRTAGG